MAKVIHVIEYLRALQKFAGEAIGANGIALCSVVAVKHDELFKQVDEPVAIHVSELLHRSGIGNERTFRASRERSVESSWLGFTPGATKRAPGLYLPTVPGDVSIRGNSAPNGTDAITGNSAPSGVAIGGSITGTTTGNSAPNGDAIGGKTAPPPPQPVPQPLTPSGNRPGFKNGKMGTITVEDLRSDERLRAIHREAVRRGYVESSQSGLLKIFGAAERALRLGKNPPAFFNTFTTDGLWHQLELQDEDAAGKRLKPLRSEPTDPAVRQAVERLAGQFALPSSATSGVTREAS